MPVWSRFKSKSKVGSSSRRLSAAPALDTARTPTPDPAFETHLQALLDEAVATPLSWTPTLQLETDLARAATGPS